MALDSPTVIARNVQASRYIDIIALVILLYNHILTLDDEVQFIWKAPTTLPKVLFLLQRYIVPIVITMTVNDVVGLAHIVFPDNYCKATISLFVFLGLSTIAISNILVLLRLWVLWDRNRCIMCWTSVAFFLSQIAAFAVASFVVSASLPHVAYNPSFFTCVIGQKIGVWDGLLWLPGLVFECMIFILVWWGVLRRPTQFGQLSGAIRRDGMTYFVVLFALRLLNMLMGVLAPVTLLNLGIIFVWCSTTVTVSNLIINIRKSFSMSTGEIETEADFELPPLHTPGVAIPETVFRKSSRKSSMYEIEEKAGS